MALVPDQKFSTFQAGGDPVVGDIIVGLRGGINTKFTWTVPATVDTITGTANQVLVDGSSGVPVAGDVTLTTPQDIATISTPTFVGLNLSSYITGALGVKDSNGNLVVSFTSSVSAVNYLNIMNEAAPDAPRISAAGPASDIGIDYLTKGGGAHIFASTSNAPWAIFSGTAFQHKTAFNFANTAATRDVTWQDASGTVAYLSDIPAGSPAALTRVDDTNVTLTLGGTPGTALLQATSITAGWTGTLSGTRGGTGVNNGASTITLGGSLTTSGAFASTFTMTNTTTVTFPTSGTLATTAQIPTGAALTKTDDTNVTLTLGGSPTTALVNAASLTLGWTGQLALTRGGTNASLTASNGGIIYSTASAMAILAGTATARQMLQSGSSTTPAWSTATWPDTTTISQLLYSSSANVVAGLSTANSAVLVTNSTGVPAFSSTLTNGQLIVGSTGTTPTAATLTAGTNISITNGAGSITINATGAGGFSWTDVTGTSQAMLSNNGYIANNAGLVTLTLPATSVIGDRIDIIGKGAGGWKVQCGGGQTIVLGSSTTTSGGSLASTQAKDSFYIICTVANTEWTTGSGPQSAGLTIA